MTVCGARPVAKGQAPAGAVAAARGAARLASCRVAGIMIVLFPGPSARAANPTTAPTVGMEGRVEVSLPGPPLEAKPADEKSPLVLRIASTQPSTGGTRYDLRYIGLVPGGYDLRKYLLRTDGSPTADLPEIPVAVSRLLPEDHQGQLVPPSSRPLSARAWYKWLMGGLALIWLLLLVPLVLAGRRRKAVAQLAPPPKPPSLADRLRPLVERAARGDLSADGKGQLERMLLGYWRRRLSLDGLSMPEAIVRLREHAEAGALLRALEDWLHRPPGAASVDVAAVLAPYRDVPADDDLMPARGEAARPVAGRV